MREKLSISEFKKIKQEMLNLKVNISTKKVFEKYIELQDKLLSYDLSGIPFEAWHNVKLYGKYINFSNTKANLDFKIIKIEVNANFNSCNVRNIKNLGRNIKDSYFDENTIKKNQDIFLSDNFSHEFKQKYYDRKLTIYDLENLTKEELEEIEKKDIIFHFNEYTISCEYLYELIGLKKLLELFKYSKNDFDLINSLVNLNIDFEKESYNIKDDKNIKTFPFSKELITKNIKEIKEFCYSYTKNRLIKDRTILIYNIPLPQEFINDNDDLFLRNSKIPTDLLLKYRIRALTFQDVINNYEYFKNINIGYFMENNYELELMNAYFGCNNIEKLLRDHFDFFKLLISTNYFMLFKNCLVKSENFELAFIKSAKNFLYALEFNYLPEWVSSLNFKLVKEYKNWDEFLTYDDYTIILDEDQRLLLNTFGFDNLKRFNEETHFFDHNMFNENVNLENINIIAHYINMYNYNCTYYEKNYEEFEKEIAFILNDMRLNNEFNDKNNYDFIKGPFRTKYSDIFMSENAPEDLKKAFYSNKINIDYLVNHKNQLPYIAYKNLTTIFFDGFEFNLQADVLNVPKKANFIDFYGSKFGNEALLDLLLKYGPLCENLFHLTIKYDDSKEDIEKKIKMLIYFKIVVEKQKYQYLENNKEFCEEYPELFIDLSNVANLTFIEKEILTSDFYNHELTYEKVRKYPQLIEVLKNKNLCSCLNINCDIVSDTKVVSIFNFISNETFLNLCSKYGRYIEWLDYNAIQSMQNQMDYIEYFIEITIIDNCSKGEMTYSKEDAPAFLLERHPELFLDDNAPEDLKKAFYNELDFTKLRGHKDWLPFLKNKNIIPSFVRNKYYLSAKRIIQYFDLLGINNGLKIGIQKPDTVEELIDENRIQLLKDWFEITGKKFIPDYVVMQNFSIDESDKFLSSIKYWSQLMKIESFSKTIEAKDAMLKLSYSFGVFDNDQTGLKKVKEILSDIPHILSPNSFEKISELDDYCFGKKLTTNFKELAKEHDNLIKVIIEEKFKIDITNDISKSFYKKSGENYVLSFNPQQYPKTVKAFRKCIELLPETPVINPIKAHQLFGGFKLEYNPDFREFLLANLNNINEENSIYIASIQRQFKEIKAINSNRVLTLDLAISYVQQNKYNNVDIGNEKMAEISSIAGYSQDDFNTLQKIYYYGKSRIFNSIPRIANKTEKYKYEMLRLDDPLALAIGTLTNCCQELHNAAEVCMEHSMVDVNGRVFVIKDNDDNIISQSWVWRNKNVLCFDNIEIPDKAFKRTDLSKTDFSQEIYNIYEKAAQELIDEDEKAYKQLLDDGKITEKQYKGLKLSKVTVGLGYNDIASAIKSNAHIDKDNISRPLEFIPPVDLNRNLYISDSTTQYILNKTNDFTTYIGDTLAIHNDLYKIYDNSNFTEKELLRLNKLELITTEDEDLNTKINNYNDNSPLVSCIAKNYNLDTNSTKIILHPNFAIIYDEKDNEIILGDIFYNKNESIDFVNKIFIQIKLALEQISKNKQFNVSYLESYALRIFNNSQNKSLNTIIDNYKGIKK